MPWGSVELESEVTTWLDALDAQAFGHVAFYLDLLEDQGALLDEPYTRQLDGKLRELRFFLNGQRIRLSYYIASGRRIVLLTVFHKTKARETREVKRAVAAMQKCIDEGHLPEDDDGN